MPGLLTGHGRPGFYLRVLHEGVIGAGDLVTRVDRVPGALTVRATSDLLYGSRHDADLLRRSIDTAALPKGWRGSFQTLLAADAGVGNVGLRAASEPPGWAGFRDFRLIRAAEESPTVRSLYLRPTDDAPLPAHRPGQFVTVRIPTANDPDRLIRSYTVSTPNDPKLLRITVRRIGQVSTRLHELAVGDTIELAAPRGTFTLPEDSKEPILLASAGVGITPMIAMLAALATEPTSRHVTWLHVTRSPDEHPFRSDTAALLARLPHASSHLHYTAAGATMGDAAAGSFVRGRPTARDIDALNLPDDTRAFLCGPPGFMEDLRSVLLDRGLPADHIHTETFGAVHSTMTAPPHPPTRRARGRHPRHLRPYRPERAVVTAARHPARTRRSLRRPSHLVVPQRCLPPLPERLGQRRSRLRTDPARPAARRHRAHLQRDTPRSRGPRPVTAQPNAPTQAQTSPWDCPENGVSGLTRRAGARREGLASDDGDTGRCGEEEAG